MMTMQVVNHIRDIVVALLKIFEFLNDLAGAEKN